MSDFNWNNVSNDLEVINLFVEREKIEAKIKALDEFSLVKYEYEKLGLDPANEDIIETEKALVINDVSKRLFTYQEMLDVFTNFADEIDTSRFYTSDDELREELEPYVKQQIKLVLNVC